MVELLGSEEVTLLASNMRHSRNSMGPCPSMYWILHMGNRAPYSRAGGINVALPRLQSTLTQPGTLLAMHWYAQRAGHKYDTTVCSPPLQQRWD